MGPDPAWPHSECMQRHEVGKRPRRGAIISDLWAARSSKQAAVNPGSRVDPTPPRVLGGLDLLWHDLHHGDGVALRQSSQRQPSTRAPRPQGPAAEVEGVAPVIPLGAKWSYDHWAGTDHPWATVGPGPLAEVIDLDGFRRRRLARA